MVVVVPCEVGPRGTPFIITMQLSCCKNYINDVLKICGSISLNEVMNTINGYWSIRQKRYSYRWGWDYSKGHHHIDIQAIDNPVKENAFYLKLVAYDIVG